MQARLRTALCVLFVAAFATACNTLLGHDSPDLAAVPSDASTTQDSEAGSSSPDACNVTKDNDDPKNCGACGHDCLGGECTLGVCQPVRLADAGIHPMALVADADPNGWLSWLVYADPSAGGGVVRLPKNPNGALPERIWANTGPAPLSRPYSAALNGGDLCWTFGCGSCDAKIWEAFVDCSSPDGNGLREVAANPTPDDAGAFYTPWGIRMDANSVFFTTRWEKGLWRAPRDGKTPVQRLPIRSDLPMGNLDLTDLAIDDDPSVTARIYWAGGGNLLSARKDGADARAIYTASGKESVTGPIVVDAQEIFWFGTDDAGTAYLRAQSKTCFDAVCTWRIVAQAQDVSNPAYPIDDGEYLAWHNADSHTLVRAKKDSSSIQTLARGLGVPGGLAVDSAAFYWAITTDTAPAGTVNGSVWRLAR